MGVVGEDQPTVIADKTVIVRDPDSGIHVQVIEHQKVPPHLVTAYESGEDLTGVEPEDEEKAAKTARAKQEKADKEAADAKAAENAGDGGQA